MKRIFLTALLFLLAFAPRASSAAVPKWGSTEIRIDNSSTGSSPFDTDLVATFTSPTGTALTVWGYYDGGTCSEDGTTRCIDDADCGGACENQQWVVEFMCDEVGQWSYTTASSTRQVDFMGSNYTLNGDSDLDGMTGSVDCVASSAAGPLEPAGNRWRYRDSGEYIAPISYVSKYFIRENNPQGTGPGGHSMTTFADWLVDNGAHILGTNLLSRDEIVDPISNSVSQEDRIYVDESFSGAQATPDYDRFYLPVWDRIEANTDLFRDRGIGSYVRLYADDDDEPTMDEGSEDEFRLFRYAVARLAAYPTVIWDTGIDITEYRSSTWINAHTDWLLANDPWRHPVSNRDGTTPTNQTHYSEGDRDVPKFSSMVSKWSGRSVPTFYTDHWREDNNRGGWCTTTSCSGGPTTFEDGDNRYLIRGAAWQTLVIPVGAIFSNRYPTDATPGKDRYLTQEHYDTFLAAPDIQRRNEFMARIEDFANMTPDPELLTSGDNVLTASNGSSEFIAYALKTHSSTFTLDLSSASGAMTAYWFHPTSGTQTSIAGVSGGGTHTFSPPNGDDWALHLNSSGEGDTPPEPPLDLNVN